VRRVATEEEMKRKGLVGMSADELSAPPWSKTDGTGWRLVASSLIACLSKHISRSGATGIHDNFQGLTMPGPAYPLSGDMQASEKCSTPGTLTRWVKFSSFSWRGIRRGVVTLVYRERKPRDKM